MLPIDELLSATPLNVNYNLNLICHGLDLPRDKGQDTANASVIYRIMLCLI